MSGHATADSLSLYLDAALPAAERERVKVHLAGCPDCRRRLAGLRRVVAGLGRLPAAAPPEDLGARVAREVRLRGRRSGWRRLLDGELPAPVVSAPPMHLLALILALGAIVYLFALGLERYQQRPTRIVPLANPRGASARPPEPAAPGVAGESLYLLGGRFRRVEGVWVEDGLADLDPDERLSLAAPAAPVPPEVAQLVALGAPLRLRVGEEVVEIAFAAGEAGGG